MLISFKMSLCRCIILAIVLCSKHSSPVQHTVGPFLKSVQKTDKNGLPWAPYLYTISWWFSEVGPPTFLPWVDDFQRWFPFYNISWWFSEVCHSIFVLYVFQRWVSLSLYIVKHSLIQSLKGESHNIRMHV